MTPDRWNFAAFGRHGVMSRVPLAGSKVVNIDGVEVPRTLCETLTCGCWSIVKLRANGGGNYVVAILKSGLKALRAGEPLDGVAHMTPKSRQCGLHPIEKPGQSERDRQVAVYRSMSRQLYARAKERGVAYP